MESVEELCEYIALIHKSEKILDGKLSEIKKTYKNNIFNVGLAIANPNEIISEITQKFQIIESDYIEEEHQLNLKVQLPNSESGSLLNFLGTKANINNFVETIPSANDIFIKTIQEKGVLNE